MPQNNQNNWLMFLYNLQKQFLCCYPLNCITWQELPEVINWEQQQQLIEVTYKTKLNQLMPIKLSYQLMFLKKLIQHLEKSSCTEIHDVIYESYCELQQQLIKDMPEKYAFKHYLLNKNVYVSLKESKTFVTNGTTGLCSWQASIALADYLIQQRELINQKIVLELGSGIGLCGFLIQKLCQPKYLLLTDGSPSCIEILKENIKLNFPEGKIINSNRNTKYETASANTTTISLNDNIMECCILNWSDIHLMDKLKDLKIDILLAADVVYDDNAFEDLSQAINYIFNLNDNKMKMFLAATVRNEFTLNGFLKKLESLKFHVIEMNDNDLKNSRLHWDRTIPIKILKIIK